MSIRWSMIFTLLPLLGACATTGGVESTPPPPSSGGSSLSPEEVESIYRARIEEARTRYTDADIDFMTGMIHHHAQAIQISRLAPTREARPSVQTLASRIINAQRDEIATMQRWLGDRGQEVPELHESDSGIMVHGAGHLHMEGMPGMLSQEQIDRLSAASGLEFDRIFLTFMIEHHQGAVTMVRTLFATDGAGQDEGVFRFASDVQVDQATEVARMQRMLGALPSGEGGA